jgi:hypothetical protein
LVFFHNTDREEFIMPFDVLYFPLFFVGAFAGVAISRPIRAILAGIVLGVFFFFFIKYAAIFFLGVLGGSLLRYILAPPSEGGIGLIKT